MTRARQSVCIGCGDGYRRTNRYKGNYCSDCHDEWSSRRESERSRPRPVRGRTTPSIRRVDDDEERTDPSRYDDE